MQGLPFLPTPSFEEDLPPFPGEPHGFSAVIERERTGRFLA